MNEVKRSMVILLILLSCIGCDQATKLIAKSVLTESATISYFNDTFRFQLALNEGAFMGLGSNLSEFTRQCIFSVGVGGILFLLLLFTLFYKPPVPYNLFSLSLILGGGFSNLIDRVLFGGKVVDFMNIGIGNLRTGIFNFADIAIALGVLIFLFSSVRTRKAGRLPSCVRDGEVIK